MKNEILMPDYNNSILNLITSILKNYKVESKFNGLEKVDEILKNKYKNIVVVILDGMGENIIKNLSPNDIFYKNKVQNITAVYPSTTAAGRTVYYSGKPPIETGWISWSQYFKEYGRNIDVLPQKDSYTGEKLEVNELKITDILKYKTIFEQIKEVDLNIKTYNITHSYCNENTAIKIEANNITDMCKEIIKLCKNNKNEQKFIMAYNDNPDNLIHKYGCYSNKVKDFIKLAEQEFRKLSKELEGTDTLILMSADHGHQDISETVNIIECDDIQECLIMPVTLESRMLGFFVKEDMKQEFEERFNKRFAEKYILYTKDKLLKSNLFGVGNKHYKIEDFIGNYIGISISDLRVDLGNYLSRENKKPNNMKSTHCGLTRNEMELPLIIFNLK